MTAPKKTRKSGGKGGGEVTLTVKVVPSEGSSREEKVKVPATGTSVGEALKAAGIDPRGLNLSIDGKPVTVDHHIKASDVLSATTAQVVATERPSGS